MVLFPRALALGLCFALCAPTATAFELLDVEELYLGGYTIVSSTRTPTGLELEVSAELTNLDAGTFDWVTAELAGGLPRTVEATGWLEFGELGPWETLAPVKGTVQLSIPRAQVRSTLRALATDSLVWDVRGQERTIYQDGVFPMDDETRDVYARADEGLVLFDAWTDLLLAVGPGDTIVFVDGDEDEPLHAPHDPWEVLDIYEDDLGIWLEVEQGGGQLMEDLILSGTLVVGHGASGTGMHQSVFSNNNLTQACALNEDEEMECTFQGIYLAENDLDLGADVAMDGGVNMKGVQAALGVRFREGLLDEVGVDISFDYEAAMAVQADAAAVTSRFETSLVEVVIPVLETQVAGVPVQLDIEVALLVGAEADFSDAVAAGLAQRGTIGVGFAADLSGDDTGFSATPIYEIEPLMSSAPTLASDAQGSFRAWAAIEAQVGINGGMVGGPTGRLGAYAQLDIDPGADPFWTISAGGEVEGTLELEVLGADIVSHTFGLDTATIHTVEASDAAYAGVTSLAAGDEVRWAENYHYGGTYGDYPADLAVLDDGDLIFATWNPAVVARVDQAGQLAWDTYLTWPSLGGLVAYDGGVLALGENGRALWIGELDADTGDLVQQHQYATSYVFDLTGVQVVDDGPTPSFLVKGTMLYSDSWFRAWLAYVTYDPAATDDPLTIHWSRIYDSQTTYGPYPDAFNGLLWDDGDLYVGGVTTAGEPSGSISYNALMAKLDSDGQPVWAKAIHAGGDSVNSLVLTDQGRLLTVGSYPQIVTQVPYFHSCWLAQWDAATGTYMTSMTLSEDLWWEAYPNTAAYPSYTTPGASIYDTALALTPLADGGYGAVGYSGLGNHKGWVMSLDSSLNVRWLSTIEGGSSTKPVILRDTGRGLAVMAQTTSPAVYGYGGTGMDTMLLSLPYDGVMAFDPATGMNSRYTKPDMVAPPSGETVEDIDYLLTDIPLVHEAATVGAQTAGISSWSLDPWQSARASSSRAVDLAGPSRRR